MTVEGENDDISGVGQTEAAHELCANIPADSKAHYLQPSVGHYGVFNGSRFRAEIAPRIRRLHRCRVRLPWRGQAPDDGREYWTGSCSAMASNRGRSPAPAGTGPMIVKLRRCCARCCFADRSGAARSRSFSTRRVYTFSCAATGQARVTRCALRPPRAKSCSPCRCAAA